MVIDFKKAMELRELKERHNGFVGLARCVDDVQNRVIKAGIDLTKVYDELKILKEKLKKYENYQ